MSARRREPAARVLGIDPGLTATGWAVVVAGAPRPRVAACGTIRTSPRTGLAPRLREVFRGLREVIAGFAPEHVAVEQAVVARNARSAMVLGQARGAALLAAAEAGLEVHEYLPMHVKQAVVGYGLAEKEQVWKVLPHLVAMEAAPDSRDAADAVAVALCHLGRAALPDGFGRPPGRARARAGWEALVRERGR